jgi:hypothetical protein
MHGLLLDVPQLDGFQKWVLLCAGGLTVIYAILRPLKKRKDPLGRAPNLSLAGQRAVEKQMTELLVELEQMARQMTAQLETRASKLDALIREADEKISHLQRLNASGISAPQPSHPPLQLTNQMGSCDLPLFPPPPALEARHAQIYELSDQGFSPRVIAQKLGRPHGEIELILALRESGAATIPA